MAEQGSVLAAPMGTVEWTFIHKRRGESRVFQQTELSIEGEARLLSLVRQVGQALTEQEVAWTALETMFDDDAVLDWPLILNVLGVVAEQAPDFVTDTAMVLLGIFPLTEDGQPNREYDADRNFIKGAINFSRWIEMVRAFTEQNDYRRLSGPFARALGAFTTPPQSQIGDGSSASSPSSSTPSPEPATEPPATSPASSAGEPSVDT